jgi:hypothetical protein
MESKIKLYHKLLKQLEADNKDSDDEVKELDIKTKINAFGDSVEMTVKTEATCLTDTLFATIQLNWYFSLLRHLLLRNHPP